MGEVYQVHWVKNREGGWLPLERVNLSEVNTQGVYVIWRAGAKPVVIRVGQGDIKSRVEAHRLDGTITSYGKESALLVTWASVPAAQRDGVERFLADRYSPLVGDAFPDVVPIPVNLVA